MSADSTVTSTRRPGRQICDTASAAYQAALEVIRSVGRASPRGHLHRSLRPTDSLKLIASENYASPAVLLTMGTWFSDKYAEGTVGHRFYAACQNVDTVEALVAEHARELFGAPYAYAQPHSGIDANQGLWAIPTGSRPRAWLNSAPNT